MASSGTSILTRSAAQRPDLLQVNGDGWPASQPVQPAIHAWMAAWELGLEPGCLRMPPHLNKKEHCTGPSKAS